MEVEIGKINKFLRSPRNEKWLIGKAVRSDDNKEGIRGLQDILSALIIAEDEISACLIYQWGEMTQQWWSPLREGGASCKQILKEIDDYLEGCSYFVGYTRSLADVFMYHLLYQVLSTLSVVDRKQFPCVCRWFNHIQQEADLRQDNQLINLTLCFATPTTPLGY